LINPNNFGQLVKDPVFEFLVLMPLKKLQRILENSPTRENQ